MTHNCAVCNFAHGYQRHHLIPRSELKTYEGRVTRNPCIPVCYLCHAWLHSNFSNRELAEECGTIDKLKQHPKVKQLMERIREVGMKEFRKEQTP